MLFGITTAVLLLFPTTVAYEYTPVQSLTAFGSNWGTFVAAFAIWLTTLMYLGVIKDTEGSRHAFLLIAFVAVIIDFWTLRTNLVIPKEDGTYNMAYIASFLQTGHLVNGFDSFYALWPAFQLLVCGLVLFTHASIITVMTGVIVLVNIVTSIFVFKLYLSILNSSRLAFLGGVLIYTGGTLNQGSVFTPSLLGILFACFSLFVVFRSTIQGTAAPKMPMMVIIVVALGFTNLISLLFFTLVTLSLFLTRSRLRYRRQNIYLLTAGILMLFIPELNSKVYLSQITRSLLQFDSVGFLNSFTTTLNSKIGGQVPLWASEITLFWQIILVLPIFLGPVIFLMKKFERNWVEKLLVCSMFGIIAFIAIFFLAGGGASLISLAFAPFLTVPFIIVLLINLGSRFQATRGRFMRTISLTLVVALLILTLPSFLAYNRNQALYTYHKTDLQGFKFLESTTTSSNPNVFIPYSNQLPYILPSPVVTFDPSSVSTPTQLWNTWAHMLASFSAQKSDLFLFSPREVTPWQAFLGVSPSDVNWIGIQYSLASHDLVFQNGDVSIFES
jgi:hypothetical protein